MDIYEKKNLVAAQSIDDWLPEHVLTPGEKLERLKKKKTAK